MIHKAKSLPSGETMPPNLAGEIIPCRQDEPSYSEDLLTTAVIPSNALTPVDLGGWGRDHVEVELPEIGSELGRYRLEAVRAMGSASVVFRATHLALGISVALKFLNRRHFSDRLALLDQLRTEASLLARIQHRNVVRLWDFDDDFDYAYLATEYIDGPTLMSAIREQGRMEPRQVIRIVLQVVDALEGLSQFNIVHRDIKPDNILLSLSGTVKLIDLGLAMIMGEEIPELQIIAPNLGWVGTPTYLPPEQARNAGRVDCRADMYSLGATLYQAVTGRPPFEAKKASQMVLHHLETQVRPPRDLVPSLTPALSDLIVRLLAKKPSDRFANYGELRGALQKCLDS